jgi:hypothetical protein
MLYTFGSHYLPSAVHSYPETLYSTDDRQCNARVIVSLSVTTDVHVPEVDHEAQYRFVDNILQDFEYPRTSLKLAPYSNDSNIGSCCWWDASNRRRAS